MLFTGECSSKRSERTKPRNRKSTRGQATAKITVEGITVCNLDTDTIYLSSSWIYYMCARLHRHREESLTAQVQDAYTDLQNERKRR